MDPPVLREVVVTLDQPVLGEIGQTARVSARPVDQYGKDFAADSVAWASSDTAVVEVSSNGTINVLSNGSAVVRATIGQVTGAVSVSVSITDPATEFRHWYAFCVDNDYYPFGDPFGLRSCIQVRAWLWARAGGDTELLLDVRNLQGSLDGHYDTAAGAILEGLLLYSPGVFERALGANPTVEQVGDVDRRGNPEWIPTVEDGGQTIRLRGFPLVGPVLGCGGEPYAASYRTCIAQGLAGYIRVRLSTKGTPWRLADVMLGMNFRVNGGGDSAVGQCTERGRVDDWCRTLTAQQVAEGG